MGDTKLDNLIRGREGRAEDIYLHGAGHNAFFYWLNYSVLIFFPNKNPLQSFLLC